MSLVFLKNAIFPSPRPRDSNSPLPRHFPHDHSRSPPPTTSSGSSSPSSNDPSLNDSPFLLRREKAISEAQNIHDERMDETHKTRIDPRIISDAIIGLSDGLTVPFALTAGLSALGSTKVVIYGGLAELIAGAISMGLGGYLAARSEAEAYQALTRRTMRLINTSPSQTHSLIRQTLLATIPSLSISASPNNPVIDLNALTIHIISNSSTTQLTDFLLACHHQASSPGNSRSAIISAATIAGGYFVGGFIALMPYFWAYNVTQGFEWSVLVMAVALFLFGVWKSWCVFEEDVSFEDERMLCAETMDEEGQREQAAWELLGGTKRRSGKMSKCIKGGLQMVVLGGVAAGAAMGLVKALG